MRKSHFLQLVFALQLLLISAPAADTVLRVRADSWMPFNGDPKGTPKGYVVDLLEEIFQAKGITVDYENMPWSETLAAVKQGQVDAAIGANPTEAKDLFVGSESIGEPRMGLFVLKDVQWGYSNIKSLNTVRLGVISGYSYWDSLDAYIASAEKSQLKVFTGETPLADGLAELDAKKVDVLAETFPVFVWAVKNSGRKVSDYRVAFKQAGEPIYVAFTNSPKGKAFASIFDEGVKQLRANGRLATILKPYGLTDWTAK